MDPDWQRPTSMLHNINWGPLNNASCGSQLMSCNIYMCVHCVHVYTCMHTVCMYIHVCTHACVCACMHACMFVVCCLATTFDKQISSHERGRGVRGVEQWIRMATE